MVAVLTASPTRPKASPHVGTASSRRYERRRLEKTPLSNVVAEHLEHRFGSALNHHVHLHACATDGVFVPTCDGLPAFLPARLITQVDLAALTEKVRGRKTTRPGVSGVVELSPFEFLDRLADLVPPPRKHRHRPAGGWRGGRAKPRLWLRPP